MNVRTAIDLLDDLIDMLECNNTYYEVLKLCVEALKKLEEYAWHDLRKNPEDLPENGSRVLIMIDIDGLDVKGYVTLADYLPCEVLKWKYIEVEE